MKMERLIILAISTFILSCLAEPEAKSGETILSTVLTSDAKEKTLTRQGRSYYDPRFDPRYVPRPLYDRLEYARPDYDRPARCGRCYEDRDRDRDDDRDDRDNDRSHDRDGYDDDRRGHKPTYGNRHDRNRNDDEDDRRHNTDRNNNNNNNGTDDNDHDGDKRRPYDDKDDRDRPSSGRNRHRNRDRDRDDDRDRYRPDYYDRFLTRDPYARPSYNRERPYYDDPYRERRPLYDRYDDPYGGGGFGGRYDGYGYQGYSRPVYDSRYDRGGGYDDVYGGYGPGVGRGPHDRPWDETYRGQAGWDAGGRGYYFASGRPEPAPVAPVAAAAPAAWGRPDYAPAAARPVPAESGWQSAGGYAGGYRNYRDPVDYRGSLGYGQQDGGYRQDVGASYGGAAYTPAPAYQGAYGQNTAAYGGYAQGNGYSQGYGQGGAGQAYGQGYGGQVASGWHSVGERIRPYRDQSGVNQLDNRDLDQNRDRNRDRYPPRDRYPGNRQPASYGSTFGQTTAGAYTSSTTQQTSYLYQREDDQITKVDETTKAS